MVTAVPSLETVIDAVHTAVSGIGSIGTVLKRDSTYEDDLEFLKVNSHLAASMDLWIIGLDSTSPFEGRGRGEQYDVYNLRIGYWSIRTNDIEWQKTARQKCQQVADTLTDNASVFEISGQVQLFTPTTVSWTGPQQRQISDVGRQAGQMLFEAVVSLQVEARRWS
jgi:hypothetical protein